jgi:3-methyladenine DNA glycosylase AlkD
MTVKQVQARVREIADRRKAESLQWFFKTGPGEYGEGDIFLGLTIPQLRKLVVEFKDLPLGDVTRLLRSRYHEERMLALLLLNRAYAKGDEPTKRSVYETYLRNTQFVNNWDLVDASAPYIAGDFLASRSRRPLYALARSRDLWERRIAIVATARFIRQNDFSDTLKISKMLLADKEDLIHKAVGWMLREVGKRDQETEEAFLVEHYKRMPRTMLRYAIERFPEPRRQMYLKGQV